MMNAAQILSDRVKRSLNWSNYETKHGQNDVNTSTVFIVGTYTLHTGACLICDWAVEFQICQIPQILIYKIARFLWNIQLFLNRHRRRRRLELTLGGAWSRSVQVCTNICPFRVALPNSVSFTTLPTLKQQFDIWNVCVSGALHCYRGQGCSNIFVLVSYWNMSYTLPVLNYIVTY